MYEMPYGPVRRVRAGNGLQRRLSRVRADPQGSALLIVYDASGATCAASAAPATASSSRPSCRRSISRRGSSCSSGTASATSASRSPLSPARSSGAWDYIYLNSVALDARGTSSSRPVRQRPSPPLARQRSHPWRLGGPRSDFRMSEGRASGKQHERARGRGTLTLSTTARRRRRARRRARSPSARQVRMTATSRGRQPSGRAALGHPGRRTAGAGRRTVRRLGLAPQDDRVRRRGAPRVDGRPAAATTATAPTGSRGGAGRRRRGCSRRRGGPGRGPRQLERGDRVARWECGRRAPTRWPRQGAEPYERSRPRSRRSRGGRFVAIRALDAAGAVSPSAQRAGPIVRTLTEDSDRLNSDHLVMTLRRGSGHTGDGTFATAHAIYGRLAWSHRGRKRDASNWSSPWSPAGAGRSL